MNINGKQWNFRCNMELGMIDIHGEYTSVQKLCNVIYTQDMKGVANPKYQWTCNTFILVGNLDKVWGPIINGKI